MASIINSTTTAGVTVTGDNSGSLQLATNNGTTAVTIDTSQNVGIGTASPTQKITLSGNLLVTGGAYAIGLSGNFYAGVVGDSSGDNLYYKSYANHIWKTTTDSGANSTGTERMRLDSSGFVMVGTTNTNPAENNVKGVSLGQDGRSLFSAMGSEVVRINRGTDDGVLVWFHQAGTAEGNISVSGTTVSYNGGHLSRWSQLPDGSKDDTILKGTVMSNLDDMCVWEKEGVVADNEQLNKMKVSDVEGDTNVAGVFVNWTIDEQYGVDDMNVAMTGDMIIRIADGVVVQKGDLLMSAGDGTAKPQGDDIRRSKTVAKVTSNHITCTYADGSYCVPCVLMAC